MAGKHFELKVIGEYEFDEVSSALQKMIRRSKEYEACYFAYLIHQSGYGEYLWGRLIVITSEDVGSGDPLAPVVVNALHQNWQAWHKHTKTPELTKFFMVVHAVLYLCRSAKNRENDSLLNLIHSQFSDGKRIEVPEIAKDIHTAVGKAQYGRLGQKDGRELERWKRWFEESSVVSNVAGADPWHLDFQQLIYQNAQQLDEEVKNG